MTSLHIHLVITQIRNVWHALSLCSMFPWLQVKILNQMETLLKLLFH